MKPHKLYWDVLNMVRLGWSVGGCYTLLRYKSSIDRYILGDMLD